VSDFRTVAGFEDVWRPPVGRRRTPEAVLRGKGGPADVRARLARIVRRAPEVMVKVTGRTGDPAHLKAHLDYISRNGELALEGRDGWPVLGRGEVHELAADWSALALGDSRRRANTPFSLSIVLSMPATTDAYAVRDAARAFAAEVFAERFDYVFALHTDAPHPHVHLTVLRRGFAGERLNPKKADLDGWRQTFAAALRERGVEAEATPRRARGVTRKAERTVLRKLRERAEAGRAPVGRIQRAVYQAAARAAFAGQHGETAWEARLLSRQRRIRALYLAQAKLLQASKSADDRELGRAVEAFVREMPPPDTQTLALARRLRAINRTLSREVVAGRTDRPASQPPERGR
jgi:type IV secretory pathway VirD2 relaxase